MIERRLPSEGPKKSTAKGHCNSTGKSVRVNVLPLTRALDAAAANSERKVLALATFALARRVVVELALPTMLVLLENVMLDFVLTATAPALDAAAASTVTWAAARPRLATTAFASKTVSARAETVAANSPTPTPSASKADCEMISSEK